MRKMKKLLPFILSLIMIVPIVDCESNQGDIVVRWTKVMDENKNEVKEIGEGEIVWIKASVKNDGEEISHPFNVSFYLDFVDEDNLIGKKHYESINKYRYPRVKWDTKNLEEGKHSIIVIVDNDEQIDELNEKNNYDSTRIKIFNTKPNSIEKKLLITEVYYYNHPGIPNEFLRIQNPSNTTVDISNWWITIQPNERKDKATKILFPDTSINANDFIYVTQNASAFIYETGELADFEWKNSGEDVSQIDKKGRFLLANGGGIIALKDEYNHTIDVVAYGNCTYEGEGWNGPSIEGVKGGIILKRNDFVDTNSSKDWEHNRIYRIGQSNFSLMNFTFNGNITTFVSPDCSFDVLVEEIDEARESIYLNIYEFTNPQLSVHLISALERNISVKLLLEGEPAGGMTDGEKWIVQQIDKNGGEVRFMVHDEEEKIFKRYRFDHAKYVIIDNESVIITSANWAITGIPQNPTFGNREWGSVIENGSIARYFLNVFEEDWNPKMPDSVEYNDFYAPPTDYSPDWNTQNGNYHPFIEPKKFEGKFIITPILSPDSSEKAIHRLLSSANESIFIQQLYIYRNWSDGESPFIKDLINASKKGVSVKVILNWNPNYDYTNNKNMETYLYLKENDIEVKFIYSNWSYFNNIHNKGMIIDGEKVLISSINWNENSVRNNREVGVIIKNDSIARYYRSAFLYDLSLEEPSEKPGSPLELIGEYIEEIVMVVAFGVSAALIIINWRRR